MSAENIAASLASSVPAGSPTEQAVAALWREVLLHTGPVEPTDNFFALGGDSLAVMIFLFRLNEVLGVDIPPGALFAAPDFRPFCMLVDTRVEPV
jgi:hypothetical protein